MVIFANLINLREDQQLLEKTWDGERVTDGPATFISWPHRRAEWPATRRASRTPMGICPTYRAAYIYRAHYTHKIGLEAI